MPKPDEEVVQIILKVMHEAAMMNGLCLQPKDIIYLDVSRQTQHTGKAFLPSLHPPVGVLRFPIPAVSVPAL